MNELSKNLMCVVVRGGIEIWLEKERADNLIKMLTVIKESKFIEFNGQILNTADITGIFTPDIMEEKTRRKNGQWYCNDCKDWHDRYKKCDEDIRIEKILNKDISERRILKFKP